MKKITKLLACFAMAFAMICVLTPNAHAATDASGGITPTVAGSDFIDPTSSDLTEYSVSFSSSDEISVYGSTYYGKIIPVTISCPGEFYFYLNSVKIASSRSSTRLYATLFKDDTCTYDSELDIGDDMDVTSFVSREVGHYTTYKCPTAGTYSLAVYQMSEPTGTTSATFKSYFYQNTANKELTSGVYQTYSAIGSEKRYSQFTLTSPCNVTIQALTYNNTEDDYVNFVICNSDKTKKYEIYTYSGNNHSSTVYLPEGTYYLKHDAGPSRPYKVKITAETFEDSSYYFTSSKTTTIYPATMYPGTDTSYVYFKYEPSKTGYLKLATPDDLYTFVHYDLLDSNKKVLNALNDQAGKRWEKGYYVTVFGVEKGNTYYIRVKSEENSLKLKMSTIGITENSGSSKSKAKSISKKTTRKGLIIAGSSQADWYKIYNPSSTHINIRFKGSTNDRFKVTLYSEKGKKLDFTDGSANGFVSEFGPYEKLPKGTYYIKVQRANSNSSGYYSLYWWTSSKYKQKFYNS